MAKGQKSLPQVPSVTLCSVSRRPVVLVATVTKLGFTLSMSVEGKGECQLNKTSLLLPAVPAIPAGEGWGSGSRSRTGGAAVCKVSNKQHPGNASLRNVLSLQLIRDFGVESYSHTFPCQSWWFSPRLLSFSLQSLLNYVMALTSAS